ncbi:MAG: endonuclease III [Clostridia bacterium]|nr:endonuclease III [Clostridia bacterium]MBP5593236.1 endonuclease III [Clostridia bacterium]MBP5648837.1 endonuclease III [Clostridia bacterium]
MNRAEEIIDILENNYPDAHCELNYGTDFQLLVSVILSAQCTDKRVNEVTARLFPIYSTPEQFASLSEEDLEPIIRPCGFFRSKARSIISSSKDIIGRFGGNVPRNFEDLLSLRGVGRKTANVICGVAFNQPAIPVDTHVYRTSHRLGLSSGKTPDKVEEDLVKQLSENMRMKAHHLLIFFGRYRCHSQKPECKGCPVSQYCNYLNNKEIN